MNLTNTLTRSNLIQSPLVEIVRDIAAENISIEQITWEITYGDNNEKTPETFIHPSDLVSLYLPRMSKNNITIEYKYNTTENNLDPQVSYGISVSIRPRDGVVISSMFQPVLNLFPYTAQGLILGILFFLSCTLTGFISAIYVFKPLKAMKPSLNVRKSYHDIRTFDTTSVAHEGNVDGLKKNICSVKNGPSILGSLSRLVLGLSLLIFKMRVSSICKSKYAKCNLESNDAYGKEFNANIDVAEKSISDLIPEKQTILAIVGILTAVGVSLSFNLGAVAPVLLSIGAFYVFLNIGSTFYLFSEKLRDILWPIVFLLIAIGAMSFQAALSIVRNIG